MKGGWLGRHVRVGSRIRETARRIEARRGPESRGGLCGCDARLQPRWQTAQEECPSRGNSLHHRHYRCHGLRSATADRNDQSASGPAVGHDAAVSRALRTAVIARCGHAQGPATRRSSQRCHGEDGRRRSEGSVIQPVATPRLPAPVRLRSLGQTSGRNGRGFRARRHGLAECPPAVSRKVPAEIPFDF
jgi:hypothetical protein